MFRSISLLAVALSACAGAPAPRTETAPPRVAEERPLPLWSVRSPDGRVSHILGTLHLGIRLEDVVPAYHQAALDEARVVIVEVDLANSDPSALVSAALLPPDHDLRAMLPAEIWPRLVETIGPAVPEAALHRLEPWAVMSLLMSREASALEAERQGETATGAAPSTVDIEVMDRARARGITVSALETIADQAAVLDAIPLEQVVEYISSVVNGTEPEGPTLRELTEAYLRGDSAELEAIVFDPDEIARSPEVFAAMIYDRNDRWMERVSTELAAGGAFVAVGLAHVIGDRGLLRLLEQRGYTVTRLYAR